MSDTLFFLDTPLLIGRGFTFGVTDDFMWAEDKDGGEWQVQLDKGKYLMFSQRVPNELRPEVKTMTRPRTMRRDEFHQRFNA